MTKSTIEVHAKEATEYDRQAREWGWNPGVFLGMMWEHMTPGCRLLDIGIGTGLASAPFHKFGIVVHGFDGTTQMLDVCETKGSSTDLRCHDIAKRPWPYEDAEYQLAICAGVFHFWGDLQSTFRETARVLATGGIFGFTCMSRVGSADGKAEGYFPEHDEASGANIYVHSPNYVEESLDVAGFVPLRKLIFLASKNPETGVEHFSTLYTAQKR